MNGEDNHSNAGEASPNSTQKETHSSPLSPQVLQLEFKVEGLRLDSSPTSSKQDEKAVEGDLQYTLSWKEDESNINENVNQENGSGTAQSVEGNSSRSSSGSSVVYNRNIRKLIQLYGDTSSGEGKETSDDDASGTIHIRVSSSESSATTKSGRSSSLSPGSNHSAHEVTPDGSPKAAQSQNLSNSETSKLATRIVSDPALRKAVELFLNHQYMHGANGYITVTVTFNPPQRVASAGEPPTLVNDPACPRCLRLGQECHGGRPCVECKREGKTDLLAKRCLKSSVKDGQDDSETEVETDADEAGWSDGTAF